MAIGGRYDAEYRHLSLPCRSPKPCAYSGISMPEFFLRWPEEVRMYLSASSEGIDGFETEPGSFFPEDGDYRKLSRPLGYLLTSLMARRLARAADEAGAEDQPGSHIHRAEQEANETRVASAGYQSRESPAGAAGSAVQVTFIASQTRRAHVDPQHGNIPGDVGILTTGGRLLEAAGTPIETRGDAFQPNQLQVTSARSASTGLTSRAAASCCSFCPSG